MALFGWSLGHSSLTELVAVEWTLLSVESDQTFWDRARSGDGEAFGQLFDRHKARLTRHSRSIAPTPSDTDDVVAITYFEAWRQADRVRFVDGSMLPWLLQTATFTASNMRRSARRHRAALERLPVPDPTFHNYDEDDNVSLALKKLSLPHQQVVVLCLVEGLTYDEASVVLGVRIGTIRSRLSRAKARLREVVEEQRIQQARGERHGADHEPQST